MSEATIQARQRKCISDLRHMIIEHHSYDVMKSEHSLCPVCSQQKYEDVLNEAYSLEKAGDCVPANYQTPTESTLASATGCAAPLEIQAVIRELNSHIENLERLNRIGVSRSICDAIRQRQKLVAALCGAQPNS